MKSITDTKKPKKGRPPIDSEGFNVRLPRHLIDALEAYRREQNAIPSRPEAIRAILTDWLIGHGHLPAPSESDDN